MLIVFVGISQGGRALSLPGLLEVRVYDETKEIKNEGECGKQNSAFQDFNSIVYGSWKYVT